MSSRHGPLRRAALVGALVAGLVLSLSASGIALGAQMPKLPSTITPTVMAVSATNPVAIPVAGSDRFATAIEASKKFGTAQNVVLATGWDFPDALGGSALAGAVRGPILLTLGTTAEPAVLAEINRLGANTVYILGGTSAVPTGVENALKARGLTVVRLAGSNRYATAKVVADKTISLLGGGYTDALAASPIMYAKGMPLVLVDGGGSYALSAGMNTVNILGGTAVVPSSVQTSLGAKAGVRLAGATRYDTAIKVAEYGISRGMSWNNLGIATGQDFPDALCAGPLLGSKNSVLLMTHTASLTPATRNKLAAVKAGVDQYYIFGGLGAITSTTRTAIATALEPAAQPAGAHDLPDVFCTGSGCHDSDLAMIHVNIAEGKTGCNYCHGIAGGPKSDCESCHVGAHATVHPVVGSTDGSCTQSGCHTGDAVAIHADCTSCHNATTNLAGVTCETCHANPHGSMAAHTVSGGGGCFDATCHGTDVTKMHGTDFRLSGATPPGCAACHAVGVTPSVTCLGACHTGSFGAYHNDTAGHSALKSSIEANSAGCVACHGSNVTALNPSRGQHNGCSCHMLAQGAGADSCVSCHADAHHQ